MSSRGWKYRCYADEPETPVTDFIVNTVAGTMAFYGMPGWIFVSCGLLSIGWAGGLCLAAGFLFSCWLVYEETVEKKKQQI